MSNIFVPASPDELKFSGVEFICPVKLLGKPNAIAALSSGGVYKGSTARSLDIYPDETEEGCHVRVLLWNHIKPSAQQ